MMYLDRIREELAGNPQLLSQVELVLSQGDSTNRELSDSDLEQVAAGKGSNIGIGVGGGGLWGPGYGGWGYRGFRGVGYRGFGYRGVGYRGVGFRGAGVGFRGPGGFRGGRR